MRTVTIAIAASLALGTVPAFAESEGGTNANTFFTQIPGVVSQAPDPRQPAASMTNAPRGPGSATFMTDHRATVSLFPPNESGGGNG